MVTFEKEKEDDRYISFLYFPEDDREKYPGIIMFDKQEKRIEIIKMAERDFERDIPPEELNVLVNAINEMKCEKGETDLVEFESESKHGVWYGDHAIKEISRFLRKGEVPDKGIQMWY